MEYNTSIYLDIRRSKSNGKFPVKLRVYSTQFQKKKLYNTRYEMSLEEFQSAFVSQKPRKEYHEVRNELQAMLSRANEICKTLIPFSFEQFEKKYIRKTGDGGNVIYHYELKISKLKANNNLGTASNYEMSIRSLKLFLKKTKGREPLQIPFMDITPEWLQNYEKYMINDLNRSRTTVSMYLRALRTIFNEAISDKEIDVEIYPFGKKKYQPPATRNVKKSLNQILIKQLFEAKPKTHEQLKARDFWFFSYSCNGMNVKDIALLRNENIYEDKIIFHRAKTINTSKSDLIPITVYLNTFSKSVIQKYGNPSNKKDDYIFSILKKGDDEMSKHRAIKNFTKFINQNLKKLAIEEGIPGEISTYWARHSFASNLIKGGGNMELARELLGHSNIETTQAYFSGFEDADKRDIVEKLMNF